jgi:hypothetical protein
MEWLFVKLQCRNPCSGIHWLTCWRFYMITAVIRQYPRCYHRRMTGPVGSNPILVSGRKCQHTLSDQVDMADLRCMHVNWNCTYRPTSVQTIRFLSMDTCLISHLICSRCCTHLFSLPTCNISQQQQLLSVADHFKKLRLVISVGRYRRQAHCDGRPRKHGFWRWNFADSPFHCIVITTSGLGMSISISA